MSSISNIQQIPSSKSSPFLTYEDFWQKYKNLQLNPTQDEETFQVYLTQIHEQLQYLKNLIPPTKKFLKKRSISLPEKDDLKKKTLFLDLDETLIHSTQNDGEYFFQIRPYCQKFLKEMSKIYEIFIFTASTSDYADAIISSIDPKNTLIDGIISREHCLLTKKNITIKDLNIIKNREIKDMILIDNLAQCFGSCVSNGIPIIPFYGDENDKELLFLIDVLKQAAEFEDCRDFLERIFQLKEIQNEKLI